MSEPYAFIEGPFGRIGLVAMDTSLAVHVHHHVHLIARAGGADTLFEVRGRSWPVAADRAVLVNAWEPHCWRCDPAAPPTLFLTFYLEPGWVRDRLGFRSDGDFRLFDTPGVVLDAAAIAALHALADLLPVLAAPGAGQGAARHGADGMGDLVGTVLASVMAGRTRRSLGGASGPRLQDHRIRRAFALLRSGTAGDLDDVAREVGLSRPRFFELFRHCTGLTPGNVANAGRMEAAIGLLTHSSQPLGSMARQLGYAAQGNFTRFFKQQIGICPTSYRRASLRAGAER